MIESNSDTLPVGERLFGYFPPANELIITPKRVTQTSLLDGSVHRAELPPGYNLYQRVNHERGYDRAIPAMSALRTGTNHVIPKVSFKNVASSFLHQAMYSNV